MPDVVCAYAYVQIDWCDKKQVCASIHVQVLLLEMVKIWFIYSSLTKVFQYLQLRTLIIN